MDEKKLQIVIEAATKEAADQVKKLMESINASYGDTVKILSERNTKSLKLEEELNDKIKKLTLSEYEYKKWALNEEVQAIKQGAQDEQKIVKQAEEYQRLSLQRLETEYEKTGQSFGDKLKAGWASAKAAWVEITAVILAMREGYNMARDAAKDLQAEESFRMVAEANHENADKMISDLKRVSAGIIDTEELMQASVKGMVLDLSGAQLVKIMETARIAARYAGEDVLTAYQNITDAIATDMPRALRKYGLITKEEVNLVSRAIEQGVEDVDLYSLAMFHGEVNVSKFADSQKSVNEQLATFEKEMKEIREGIGKAEISTASYLLAGAKGIDALIVKILALDQKWQGHLEESNALMSIANDLTKARNQLLGIQTEEEKKAAASAAAQAQAEKERAEAALKAEQARLRAALEAKEKEKKAFEEAERARKAADEAAETAVRDKIESFRNYLELVTTGERAMTEAAIEKEKAVKDATYKELNARAREIFEKRKDQISLQQDVTDKINQLILSEYDYQVWTLENETKAMIEHANGVKAIEDEIAEYKRLKLEKLAKEYKSYDSAMINLSKRTAEAMEQNFSDLFFGVMRGEFDDLGDYADAMLESMERALADYMGQLAKEYMFGKESGGSSSGGWLNAIIAGIGSLFGGGATADNSIMYAANGADYEAGKTYVVGEKGPEIFRSGSSGTIIPNDKININSGKNGGDVHLHLGAIQINAVDAASFNALARRNPTAILGPFISAIEAGNRTLINRLRSVV